MVHLRGSGWSKQAAGPGRLGCTCKGNWKRAAFIPTPKEGSAREYACCRPIALISHACRGMLEILQARLQQYVNCELPDTQAGFKAEEPEIKLPKSVGSSKKQESSRKISISALLIMPKPLTFRNKVWKILKEMRIPDHLTCLLRNLYAGQEATVRTGHGTTDWFQNRKGVRQGCILSPCLFNFYAEYITRNARLDEAQAGIKIVRRNINNLRKAVTPPLWQKVKMN